MAQEELWLALKADIGDVKGKLNSITSEGNKVTSTLGAGFKKLGGIIAGAFAIGAVIKFGSTSLKAFAESEGSALSLANTLKNVVGLSAEGIKTIEDAVNKLEVATAFDDVEIRTAMKSMLMRTGDINLAIKSLPVAMEMARATGQDLTSMMDLLGLGFQGQARGLRQFGITTVEGKTKLEILDMVMGKVKGSMGAFAKTTTGSVADMQTSWGNLKEMVGGAVAPVFAGFNRELALQIGLMIGGVSTSEEYSRSLGNLGGSVVRLTSKLFVTTGALLNHLIQTGVLIETLINPFKTGKDLDRAWKNLQAISQDIRDIWEEEGRWSPEARKSLEDILNEVNKATQGFKGLRVEADTTGDKIADAFKPAWEPITLMGGNLPELSRFIGNLRYAQPVVVRKSVLEVIVYDKSKVPSATSKAVVGAIKDFWDPRQKSVITESHGTGR